MATKKNCNQHPICVSSNSNLPECKCWCAECKEQMQAARERGVTFGRLVRA